MGSQWRPRVPAPSAYVEMFRDKRVVLVGPAASLTGRGQGPYIDAHDVVVRLNLASPVPPEMYSDLGTRTDVLVHVLYGPDITKVGRKHTAEEVAGWRSDGVRYLVTRQDPDNDRVRRIRPLLGGLPMVHIDPRTKDEVKRASGTNPNTGTLAIAHLLSMPIASLHVTGFDFYMSGYYTGYGGFTSEQAAIQSDGVGYAAWGQAGRTREVHRQDGQKAYLAGLYRNDRRLTFDDIAAQALGVSPRGPGIVALVPMKGDSERVPGKNMRSVNGKPLLYWTLAALHEAQRVEQVVVDTDSDEIAALVRRYFPDTLILDRPARLRDGAKVTGNELIKWEMSQVEGEHFGQFHVTSPLLRSGTIDAAVDAYFHGLDEHDSLFTVTEHHFWLFRADGSALNSDTRKLIRSQDLEPLYEDNNAAHVFSRASFKATGSRIGERPQMFPIGKIESTDIDYEEDFEIAEALLKAHHPAEAGLPKARRGAAA
jgi:CMP-N-acetylneuraminic acid synthetase